MAEIKAKRVREDVEGLYCWTLEDGDQALPLIVDFRALTVVVPRGMTLEGAIDPAGSEWFTLHASDRLPLLAPMVTRLTAVEERVYHVRPVGVGTTWLHTGGK